MDKYRLYVLLFYNHYKMGKGKKQRIQENKKQKLETNDSDEEIKHVDAEDLDHQQAELTPEQEVLADYGFDKMDRHELFRVIQQSEDIDEIIALTAAKDDQVRLKACKEMCPCHVKADCEEFWNATFRLANDPNDDIRYQVLHNMCDGSPPHLEDKVIKTLEIFNRDSNKKIRRKAHQVMGSYLHTGEWNIM